MKYNIDAFRPKLEEFLKPVLAHAGFELKFELKTPENPHPEVENPDVTVHFSGPDVELLLENRAELLLALEHLSMEALRLPAEDPFLDELQQLLLASCCASEWQHLDSCPGMLAAKAAEPARNRAGGRE